MPFIGTKQIDTVSVGLPIVSHELRAESLPAPVHLHAQLSQFMNPGLWRGADNREAAQNVVAKFGQSMSLSKVYSRADLFTNAKPYAGLSCVGLAWNRCCPVAQTEQEMLDTRKVTPRVIGLVAQAVVALGHRESSRSVATSGLAVMRVYRSREFEEQSTNQAYGSVALSIEF